MTSGYITQGKIVRVVSIYGTYEVLATSKKRIVQAIAVRETSSHLYGVRSSHYYLPGTPVVMFVPDQFETGGQVGLILGAANDVPIINTGGDNDDKGQNPYKMLSMLDNSMSYTLGRSDASLKTVPKDTALENDYSYGVAADVLPGEWAKTTYTGGGFFLNDFLAAMRISEAAKIECILFKDLLRLTARAYQERTAANEKTVFIEGVLNSAVERKGATMLESMGSLDGNSPVESNEPSKDDPYLYKYKKHVPYFNHQTVSNFLPQGELETITLPPKDVEEERPPGALSIYKGYDGTYNVKALREISFEKTSIIPVPWAFDEPDTILKEEDRSEYEPKPYFENAADLKDEAKASFFGAEAVRQINEYNLEKDSFENFRTRDLIWSIPKDKKEVLSDLKKAGADFKDDPEIGPLPTTEPYYSDPPVKTGKIKAAVNEEGKREKEAEVFDISSFVRQTADGSIIISGGWGEEIRMYRGNIYLTCPGDIIKTPGRDSVLMAGGNNIQKANKGTTEIESETTTLIANGNLQVLAGAKESGGTLIIENKSKAGPDMGKYAENMENNESVGGGILMKGTVVTALSNNIYLQGDNPDNSQITLKAGNVSEVAKQAMTYIQQGGQHTVVTPSSMVQQIGSSVNIVAKDLVGFNTSNIKCHSGKVQVPFRDFDDKDTTKDIAPNKASFLVQGHLMAQSVDAGSMSTVQGGELSKNPTFLNSFNKLFIKNPPGYGAEKTEAPLCLTDMALSKELKKWGIVLPKSRYTKLELPLSRWQTMLKGSENWKAVEIDQDGKKAMSFPGEDNFTAAGGLQKLEDGGKISKEKLSEGLIINSQ